MNKNNCIGGQEALLGIGAIIVTSTIKKMMIKHKKKN